MMRPPLVTTTWLQNNLNNQQLVLLDASMEKVVGKEKIIYDKPIFIPRSKRLDLEYSLCNLASAQIHAFPTEEQFTAEVQRLGVNADSVVVIYDNQGVYSAPRAWWIFRSMGFNNVFVLDGGLPQWLAEYRDTVPALSTELAQSGRISANYQSRLVCDSQYVLEQLDGERTTILDARSNERFLGLASEPRAGVRSGHIPQSLNLPFAEVLDAHCFKKPEQLTALFSKVLDDKNNQLIFSCGSGVTACIILIAAVIAGYNNTVLYDGSWADWGSDVSLPLCP